MKKFISLSLIVVFFACTETKSTDSQFSELDQQLENLKTSNKNSLILRLQLK